MQESLRAPLRNIHVKQVGIVSVLLIDSDPDTLYFLTDAVGPGYFSFFVLDAYMSTTNLHEIVK